MNNIEMLSFLIASYKNMVAEFGENEKTNNFFIQQLSGLVNIKQVDVEDARVICDVIGLKKDNADFNWETSRKNVDSFINVMNTIGGYSDKNLKTMKLWQLYEANQISKLIFETICNIYGIDINQFEKQVQSSNNFGTISKNNTIFDNVNKKVKGVNSEYAITEWKKFLQKYNDYYFDIHNPSARGCSGQSFFRVKFNEFLKLFNTDKMTEIYCFPNQSVTYKYFKLLAQNPQDFEIVHTHDDGCHTSYRIDMNVDKKAHTFDYKKIFDEHQILMKAAGNKFFKSYHGDDDMDRDRD